MRKRQSVLSLVGLLTPLALCSPAISQEDRDFQAIVSGMARIIEEQSGVPYAFDPRVALALDSPDAEHGDLRLSEEGSFSRTMVIREAGYELGDSEEAALCSSPLDKSVDEWNAHCAAPPAVVTFGSRKTDATGRPAYGFRVLYFDRYARGVVSITWSDQGDPELRWDFDAGSFLGAPSRAGENGLTPRPSPPAATR